MIRFRNYTDMRYYDIHTHQIPFSSETVVSIFSMEVEQACKSILPAGATWFSAGIHPWKKTPPALLPTLTEALKNLLENPQLAALGECGLDRCTGQALNDQIRVFESQIELSERFEKPLIIHCVKAYNELIGLRRSIRPVQPWIIHGFRGKNQLAAQLQNDDFYLSFGKYFYQNIFTSVDMRRILLETDDESDLTIGHVYDRTAEVAGMAVDEFALQIEKNVATIFPGLVAV